MKEIQTELLQGKLDLLVLKTLQTRVLQDVRYSLRVLLRKPGTHIHRRLSATDRDRSRSRRAPRPQSHELDPLKALRD